MDFIGLKTLMQCAHLYDRTMLCNAGAMLYDSRYRRSIIKQSEIAVSMGMIVDYEHTSTVLPTGILIEACQDEWKRMAEICTVYFYSEPRYIPMTQNVICKQRKESFDHWREHKLARIIFAPPSSLFKGLMMSWKMWDFFSVAHQKNVRIAKNTQDVMIKNFANLPFEAVYRATISTAFPLPLTTGDGNLNQIINEWLLVLSWYKKVICELEPALCELRESKTHSASSTIVVRKQMENLSRILRSCWENKDSLFQFPLQNTDAPSDDDQEEVLENSFLGLADIDLSILQNLKTKIRDILFVKRLISFSVNVVDDTIMYIASFQKIKNISEVDDDWPRASTVKQVHATHWLVDKMYAKRWCVKFKEDDAVEMILQRVGNTLKTYRGKNYFSSFESDQDIKRYQHYLHHMQKFISEMMIEAILSLMVSLYKCYNIDIKQEHVKNVLLQIISLITCTAMINTLNQSGIGTTAKLSRKLIAISEILKVKCQALLPLLDYAEHLQHRVDATMLHCMSIIVQPEAVAIPAPISIVYDDFPRFLAGFSQIFHSCPHLLVDFNQHTDGRLYKYMMDTLVTLEDYRERFEQLFKLAEYYIKSPEDDIV